MGYILSAVILIIMTLCIAIFFHISLFSPFAISALAWLLSFFLLVSRRVNYVC